MGINVTIDLSGATRKTSQASERKAQLEIANQALLDMEPYVPLLHGPLLHGPLRSSGHVAGDGSKIIYNTPYARAQFYGGAYNKYRSFSFSKYTTPGTGKRWDLKASANHGNKWAEVGLRAMGFNK